MEVRTAELGKYTLVAELARGGMGVIYLAQVQGPGGFQKMVVVKELKRELAEDPKFREMFLDEANLAARLNHRNIVQTNEVVEEGGRYFMAMDYLEGCSLHTAHKRLTGDKKLTLAMELRVLAEVLAGLHYAHELNDYDGSPLGVVHRDVGPQNVYLTFDGQVKLLDFGVAKVLNRQQETQAGVLKGRVAYMAPEQVSGSGVDRRVDIFAAGVMLREVITGLRLWDGLGEIDTLKRLIARDIPKFPDDPKYPAELRAICDKAMAPDRENRFKTAHEMRVAVDLYVSRVDPSGTLTDLSSHLARELSEERKRLKDVIDASLSGGGPTSSIPSIDFPMVSPSSRDVSGVSSGGGGTGPSSGGSGPSSSRRQPKTPASGTLAAGLAPEIEVEVDASALNRPAPAKKRGVIVAGIAVVAVVVLVLVFAARRNKGTAALAASGPGPAQTALATPEPALPKPQGAIPVTSAPAAAAAADTVEISVRVSPSNAQIFVDDALVDGNPFHATFRKNSAMHSVRAVAPGFVGKSELVKFDANSNMMLSLERLVGPAVAAPAPPRPAEAHPSPATSVAPAAPVVVAPAAPTAKAGDINLKGGKAPKRDIDPKNPYGAE
jgi:serine/threonine-protein kinase